jgi:multiple antibiotic resistance protein
MPLLAPFLKSLVLVPLTLLPIINPLSAAPVFIQTAGSNPLVVRRMALQIAINSWFILVVSMLVGIYVLDIFGISLPIVRLGGGLLVAASGWHMLHDTGGSAVQKAVADQAVVPSSSEISMLSFFPITFPLTTGPGTIAAAIALGVHLPRGFERYLLGATIAVLGVAITVMVVYFCYRYATRLLTLLGPIGTMVIMRLLAFILLCIGIEIMWSGWAALNAAGS